MKAFILSVLSFGILNTAYGAQMQCEIGHWVLNDSLRIEFDDGFVMDRPSMFTIDLRSSGVNETVDERT